MSEKRAVRVAGGFERTVYPTALGELWATGNVHGPAVKLLGDFDEPCVHYLTEQEARDAAAALVEVADEIAAAAARG